MADIEKPDQALSVSDITNNPQGEISNKKDKVKIEKRKNARVTKIFVSQKETCYNGRLSTNPHELISKRTDAHNS